MAGKKGKKRKRARSSGPRLRYRSLAEEVERASQASADLGEYAVKWLDEALEALRRGAHRKAEKLIRRVLRRGQASMIGRRRDKSGKTVFVDHLVVNSRGRIKHYGVHGARGWNPRNPEEVQFKNKKGEDLEYEEIGPHKGGKRTRRGEQRGRGWKKTG